MIVIITHVLEDDIRSVTVEVATPSTRERLSASLIKKATDDAIAKIHIIQTTRTEHENEQGT